MALLNRGYDTSQTDESRLVEQRNLDQQNKDSLPAYPHTESEPQETRAEHGVEQAIGREIRPANPYNKFTTLANRQIPAKMTSCTVPTCTNSERMLRKPAPAMNMTVPRITRDAPAMMTGNMLNFTRTPKKKVIDPFRGLDGGFMDKKLPDSMKLVSTKKKRGIW